MKRMILAAAALAASAGMALADPLVGTMWKTEVDDGSYAHVEMSQCGSAVCGTFVKTFNESGEYSSPNIGKRVVLGMVPQGGGAYKGEVWRPSNDKIYVGKMQVNGNKLALRGCVAGGLICAKQTWTKLN